MQRFVLLFACLVAFAGFLPMPARSDGSAPSTSGTPPPQIYHIVTTALCARLHEVVRPAVAMVLENDRSIAKSQPLFKKYAQAAFASGDPTGFAGGDSINVDSPGTNMALEQMSDLVLPTAHNLISAQTLLDDQKFLAPTGNSTDDATLALIKKQLLETLAFQSASLDLINGFVQTQQMGDLQHVGTEYLAEISGSQNEANAPISATPNPWQDPNTPGITQNPYAFDPTTIPGLAVGYNPLTKIQGGLQWVQDETAKREDTAGKTISAALAQCPK